MSKKQKKKIIGKITVLLIIIVVIAAILAVVYVGYKMIYKVSSIKDIFEGVETKQAIVSEYIVYGTHLNIKGNLSLENTDEIQSVKLAFRTINEDEPKEMELSHQKTESGIEFATSELINEGIYLEELPVNTYYLLVKIGYTNGTYKYYSLKNGTEYTEGVEYYTITKNDKNNKIDIKFASRTVGEQRIDYMYIGINRSVLPAEVYDVVIDPGHGGSDIGAEYGGYREATLTLKIANAIKEELENLGLKVRITRDGTEGNDYGVYSVYDTDGRVNLVGKSRAKYVFSIHLNSVEQPNSLTGVEVYAPTRINLDFAKAFAENIVKTANTRYSNLDVYYKKAEGVYVRTFTENNIENSAKDARRRGYKPYDIKENTPYLYMLRETGGIATNAYVDGRNPEYGVNLYYDSNIGVEAYLLELGYINHRTDIQNIVNNQKLYVDGIVKTIKDELLGEDYVATVKKDDKSKDKNNTNS